MTDEPDGRALVERLRAERDERRRLAELIHDGPVQLVAALSQMLDAAHDALGAGDVASGSAIVERALAVAREAGVDLREIVSGIEPDALRELGLAAASQSSRSGTRPVAASRSTSTSLEEAKLGEGVQSGLYQIVRDAVDQAVRRGPPGRVRISLVASDAGVELRIEDDGVEERRAAVLATLAERVGELNGSFTSETSSVGTMIAIRLPPSAAQL